MSHFTVLVIGTKFGEDEVEELLYPYWELDLNRDEISKDPRAVFEVKCKKEDLEKEFKKWKEGGNNAEYKYESAEDWADDWHSWYKVRGNYGYYYNPKAKWDWYLIGGRWTGFFKVKEGTKSSVGKPGLMTNKARRGFADQIRKCDIDINGTIENRKLEWERNWAEAQKHQGGKEFIFGVKEDESLEDYLKRQEDRHPCQTFVVIKDGKWYEKGETGWWGIVSGGKQECDWSCEFKALWEEIPNNAVLTIVDCHI